MEVSPTPTSPLAVLPLLAMTPSDFGALYDTELLFVTLLFAMSMAATLL
jgi:hypothetical protein